VAENRDRLSAGEVSRLEAAIADLRRVAQGEDLSAIRKATDDVQRAAHAIVETLYKGSSGSSSSGGSSGSGVKDAEVVDAEYAESA
jgi:molecular chaperone DnaK